MIFQCASLLGMILTILPVGPFFASAILLIFLVRYTPGFFFAVIISRQFPHSRCGFSTNDLDGTSSVSNFAKWVTWPDHVSVFKRTLEECGRLPQTSRSLSFFHGWYNLNKSSEKRKSLKDVFFWQGTVDQCLLSQRCIELFFCTHCLSCSSIQ